MSCLIPFFNPAITNKIDVLITNKERWFRVSDIALALGYCDGVSITYRWQEEVSVFTPKDLPGVNLGARHARFITCEGLLALLLSSSRPLAQLLRKWIIEEVLPSIDSLAYDIDTGRSALDKAILAELEALKKSGSDLRKKQVEHMERQIQLVANAVISWADSAPKGHIKLFEKALQEAASIGVES